MPAESIKLLRLLRIVYEASASATVELYTDMGSGIVSLKASWTLAATDGIQVATLPIRGNVKGFQLRVKFIPTGTFIAYQDSAIYARRVGRAASDWQWFPLPIVPSGGQADVKIPIPPSGGQSDVKIPIPPSGGDATLRIPVPESPEQQMWVDLPEDE
jgi:hypothetical protein